MILLKDKVDLINLFRDAIHYKRPVALFITIPGCPKPELIVNQPENLEYKLEYYLENYDPKILEHKKAKGVRIVGYTVLDERW